MKSDSLEDFQHAVYKLVKHAAVAWVSSYCWVE